MDNVIALLAREEKNPERKKALFRQSDRFNHIARYLPRAHNLRVLDVGGGAMVLSVFLKLNGAKDVCAVDIESALKLFSKRARKYKIKTHKMDISTDSFPVRWKERFDCILFIDVLEHLVFLNKSKETLFSEFHDMLVDGGIVVLSTPNIASIRNVIKLFLNRNIIDEFDESFIRGRTEIGRTPHIREYTIAELKKLLTRFTIDVHAYNRETTNKIVKVFSLAKRFRDDIVVVGKRASV